MHIKQLLVIIAVVFGLRASAQSYVGTWEMFPSYSNPTKLIETPEYVYTLAGTSLCGYDKQTGEVAAYNSSNRLNGNKVTNMWYNPDEKYLFAVYEDYDIDLVYDDGRIVNIPDLRDAASTAAKTVNDVSFANGKIFVGFASGMLVMDAAHGAVTESCLWGLNVTRIAATDSKIMVYAGSTVNQMRVADQAGSHHNFDNSFKAVTGGFNPAMGMERLDSDRILAVNAANAVLFTFADGEEMKREFIILNKTFAANNLQPTRNGLLISNAGNLFYIAKDGTVTERTVAGANAHKVADWAGDCSTLWLADASGYGKYDVASSSFAIAKARPRGTSGTNVGRIIQHPVNDKFYLSTIEQHQNTAMYQLAFGKTTKMDVYSPEDKTFTPVSSTLLRSSLTGMGIAANQPKYIFAGYHGAGARIADIESNNYVAATSTNTPLSSVSSPTTFHVDNSGNLWICEKDLTELKIVKALKGSWESDIDNSGWSKITLPLLTTTHSTRMIVDEAHGVVIGTGKNGIAAVQMPEAGKPLTASTRTAFIDCASDEDGASMGAWNMPTLALDKNGWVWIGYESGVMVIKDSSRMFDPGFEPMRPKVARNDGTNLADYLLTNVEVMCIAVDENNQKWIGTVGSGLYRVNEDGTSILENFTTDNSSLPSNDVLAVCPDRNSNDIYVGTSEGLSIYHSTTSPAADDYKDAYAYPNPVLPEYAGYITITGLKANSLVKITDASGNIFFETRSDGGMAVWNGCDASGRRVRSGVYFVFASEAGEGGSDAAVTKIVVIN